MFLAQVFVNCFNLKVKTSLKIDSINDHILTDNTDIFLTVSFTGEEPMSGWATINDTTPGLCLAVGLGAVRVLYMSYDTPAVFAPADKVSNMVITSAWHASKTRYGSKRYIITLPVFRIHSLNPIPF